MAGQESKSNRSKSTDSLDQIEPADSQTVEQLHPPGGISRITSSIRAFFDDWQRRKALADLSEVVYKPRNQYRDQPELTINNLSPYSLKKMGLERLSINPNPALQSLFSDFLSVLKLKIGDAYTYQLSDKYRQITGYELAFNFTCIAPILNDLINSEYFLNSHKYLLEANQEHANYSEAESVNPESLLGHLVAVAERKAGKYIFKPHIPSKRHLSKMDLEAELFHENKDDALARFGFDPAIYRLGLLPFAAILADPEQFSTARANYCLVEVFLRQQNSDFSFLAEVSGGRVQLLENCYFGSRKHEIAGRIHCNKNHRLGEIRLLIEKK